MCVDFVFLTVENVTVNCSCATEEKRRELELDNFFVCLRVSWS